MTGNASLETPFFDTHADTLHDLFVVLGREAEWRDNPADLLPYTQAKWIGQEHGNSAEKDQFSPDQEAAAKAIMPRLGLQQEVLPLAYKYEQVVIIGGMMRVNRERIGFMKRLLETHEVQVERVVFWAGQRLRDSRDDVQVNDMDLETLSIDHWVRDELARPAGPAWESSFATETQLARLAYVEHFPKGELNRTTLAVRHSRAADLPGRDIASYMFTAEGYPEFTLMNCAAVERPAGPPRHTTNSCAAEWLQTIPPSNNARILVAAGNPHILRSSKDIQRKAEQHDRQDITFDICGPAANPNASIQLYLGEVGRLLYMDVLTQEANPSRP